MGAQKLLSCYLEHQKYSDSFKMDIKSLMGRIWVHVISGEVDGQLSGSNGSDHEVGVRMRIIQLAYSPSQLI